MLLKGPVRFHIFDVFSALIDDSCVEIVSGVGQSVRLEKFCIDHLIFVVNFGSCIHDEVFNQVLFWP